MFIHCKTEHSFFLLLNTDIVSKDNLPLEFYSICSMNVFNVILKRKLIISLFGKNDFLKGK